VNGCCGCSSACRVFRSAKNKFATNSVAKSAFNQAAQKVFRRSNKNPLQSGGNQKQSKQSK